MSTLFEIFYMFNCKHYKMPVFKTVKIKNSYNNNL